MIEISNSPSVLPVEGQSTPNISGYDVLKELGRGSFGKVCLARRHENDQQVAIKMMHSSPTQFAFTKKLLQKEYSLMKGLKHPNILQVFASGVTSQGLFYFGMELATMGSLDDLMLQKLTVKGFWTEERAKTIMFQAASGLNYLHSANLCHRDIKPDNIVFDYKAQVKIIDFGVAAYVPPGGLIHLLFLVILRIFIYYLCHKGGRRLFS
uniref:non-specific serine/threonine protein kinase n=1 Tax=Eptatretus burgeri TaxID=7764 RepID=A0A8C4NCB6_EPTBU